MTSTVAMAAVARSIAETAHAGQVDKAGRPYIEHSAAVAIAVAHLGNEYEAAGWLHDVIEDTEWTRNDLAAAGMPEAVCVAVELVTRREWIPSGDYYAAIRENPIALAVKLADVEHNADPERLALLDERTRARLTRKYAHARMALA